MSLHLSWTQTGPFSLFINRIEQHHQTRPDYRSTYAHSHMRWRFILDQRTADRACNHFNPLVVYILRVPPQTLVNWKEFDFSELSIHNKCSSLRSVSYIDYLMEQQLEGHTQSVLVTLSCSNCKARNQKGWPFEPNAYADWHYRAVETNPYV